MDILSNLPYTFFGDFYIRVNKIKYGWMELCVGIGDKCFNYQASYTGDPLNYLLAAAVSVVKNQKSTSNYNGVAYEGEYFYITHDLEPSLVTWLFKPGKEKLTLIIWEDMPLYFEEMIDGGFDCSSPEIQMLDNVPDITADICFAIKDSPVAFVKALLCAVEGLTRLERQEDEAGDNEWGHSYSLDNVELLKSWLVKNEHI